VNYGDAKSKQFVSLTGGLFGRWEEKQQKAERGATYTPSVKGTETGESS